MKEELKKNRLYSEIKKLFEGYASLFKFLYSDHTGFLKYEVSIKKMVPVLGLVGILRVILQTFIGGPWSREWFSLSPDIFLTLFFYPIFLCFFSAAVLHLVSNGLLNLEIEMRQLLMVLFFLQIIHLLIPLLDGLGSILNIPFRIWFGTEIYSKLIFSPLAFTPLILFFTYPTSLGIDITWIFVSIVFLKLYLNQLKFPLGRSLTSLMVSLYIVYMSIYPVYFFFLNEVRFGSNYLYGFFFLLLSVPSVIYCKSKR